MKNKSTPIDVDSPDAESPLCYFVTPLCHHHRSFALVRWTAFFASVCASIHMHLDATTRSVAVMELLARLPWVAGDVLATSTTTKCRRRICGLFRYSTPRANRGIHNGSMVVLVPRVQDHRVKVVKVNQQARLSEQSVDQFCCFIWNLH